MQAKVIFILHQDNVFKGKFFHQVWIDPETWHVTNVVRNLAKYGRVTSPKLIVEKVDENKWLIQSEQSIEKRGHCHLNENRSQKNKYVVPSESKKIISIDINSSEKVDKKLFLQRSVELFFPAEIDYIQAIDILLDKLK